MTLKQLKAKCEMQIAITSAIMETYEEQNRTSSRWYTYYMRKLDNLYMELQDIEEKQHYRDLDNLGIEY